MIIFPLFLPGPKGDFLGCSQWEPGGLPGGTSTKGWRHTGLSCSRASYTQPPAIHHICHLSTLSFQLLELLLQVIKSWPRLSGFTCLSRLWDGGFSWNLGSLMDERKVVDCQIVYLFLLRVRVIIHKLFSCQSWNSKSNVCLVILYIF